jgi:hypothetical protein
MKLIIKWMETGLMPTLVEVLLKYLFPEVKLVRMEKPSLS